jgi:undecaprenyl diphosphate synthase
MSTERIPSHLAIIIDGNRRWAKKNGLSSFQGHKKGLDNVQKIGDYCIKKGVKILTLYVFSSENWNRSKKEVAYLMRLFVLALSKKNIEKFNRDKIKFQAIGQIERLPKSLQNKIRLAEESTKNNKKGILNLAISYGGRPEIIQAIKKIIKKKIPASKINEEIINQNLWTANLPYPDLIIRTGGEQRLSNFLTWQTAYSEFYFTKRYWPEFNNKDIDKALEDYSIRERRFGK